MSKVQRRSSVDYLAEQVSALTGSDVRVHRVEGGRDLIGRRRIFCYNILVERDGHGFSSGYIKLNEAKKFLALVSDWISMGFIRVQK